MSKFRKKPVVIDAIQWTGDNREEIDEFMGESRRKIPGNGLQIYTLEGIMDASVGDYIIKGIKGEFYPCKPDIFEMTYEPVEVE
jgi:hypothetical protein